MRRSCKSDRTARASRTFSATCDLNCAAIRAAREGARTLLLEGTGFLGGLITGGRDKAAAYDLDSIRIEAPGGGDAWGEDDEW